jgi:hypothetical protein
MGPSISHEENSVVDAAPGNVFTTIYFLWKLPIGTKK